MSIGFRNTKKFYYAQYLGKTAMVDKSGYETGEYENAYSKPTPIRGNISPAKGKASEEMFGADLSYSKTIIVDGVNCPINEQSILWIETSPESPHNYIVVGVARSLNTTSYAVKEVNVK